MRLPPLQYLRVREANKAESNPCMTVMSSVLGESLRARRIRVRN